MLSTLFGKVGLGLDSTIFPLKISFDSSFMGIVFESIFLFDAVVTLLGIGVLVFLAVGALAVGAPAERNMTCSHGALPWGIFKLASQVRAVRATASRSLSL